MAVSACPKCTKQVTIPAGVDTSALVRCPLCHAQYALADALVNMPPLLELVVESPGDWPQEPLESAGEGHAAGAAETIEFSPDFGDELDAPADFDDLSPPAAGEQEQPAFEPLSEHDDMTIEEKDTEVEELGFAVSDPLVRDVPDDLQPMEIASDDDEDSVLDFDSETPPGVDVGTPRAEVDNNDEDDNAATLEFSQFKPIDDDADFELNDAADAETSQDAEEIAFNLAEPDESSASAAGSEEIEVDFGAATDDDSAPVFAAEPSAADEAAEATPPAEEEATGKKKKKKKEKKVKAPREPGSRRSMSTVLSALLGAIVAVPLALYGVLWMGPDYDFFGVASVLPKAILPSSFSQPKYVATNRQVLPATPAPIDEPAAEPAAAEADNASTDQPTLETPATDEAPPEPSPAPADAAPPTTEPATVAPADEPATSELPANEPATTEPATTEPAPPEPPADDARPVDPFAETAPDDNAKEMPAEPGPSAEPSIAPEAPAAEPEPAADAARPSATEELPSPTDPATPAEPSAAESTGPIAAPAVGVAELAKAISDAATADEKMVAAMAAGNEAELKKARNTFYLSLFGLAEAATFAKDDSGSNQLVALHQGLERALRQFSGDPKRVDSLRYNAARWLAYPKRTTNGIVLAGTVQSSARAGKLHEVKLAIGLDTNEPIVTVVSAADPQLSPGDRAFVLGSIVENPTSQLPGYEGGEPSVVWNGMTVKDTTAP